ncbi:MAG: imidazole glycerol phosphate synthase subunit HisH [Anaerolineales bacterium]|nr:imidazole glycerol phosphate synthase subunit HisH [Anaerolineales bacterium]
MVQPTVTLIDYGAGNIRSVQKAFEHVGTAVQLTADPEAVRRADKLVLPGVGAFGASMAGLQARGLPAAVQAAVQCGVPFLGICVGMQLMFTQGLEMGTHAGLDLMAGTVRRFPEEWLMVNGKRSTVNSPAPIRNPKSQIPHLKVPHMGWNQLEPAWGSPLLAGIRPGDYAYFVHSYYCDAADPTVVLAWTDYGLPFPAIVARDNLFGLQFHPEKSQQVGLRILRNFVDMH